MPRFILRLARTRMPERKLLLRCAMMSAADVSILHFAYFATPGTRYIAGRGARFTGHDDDGRHCADGWADVRLNTLEVGRRRCAQSALTLQAAGDSHAAECRAIR